MNSLTKRDISHEIITKLAKKAFPNLSYKNLKIKALTDGCFNSAYMLSFDDCFTTVLKVAPSPTVKVMTYEQNIMQAEVNSMRMIGEKTSIPVPKIYFYDRNCDLVDSEYFFMEEIKGVPFSQIGSKLTDEQICKIQFSLGKFVHEMSQVTNNKFGLFAQLEMQFNSWKTFFLTAIETLINDATSLNTDFGISVEKILNAVDKHSSLLDEIEIPRFIHWDLWEGNVFIQDDKITGIVDFERCMWGDPLMENIFSHYTKTETSYTKGYGIDKFTENQLRRRHLYNLYMMALMCVEPYFRGYTGSWLHNYALENLSLEVNWLLKN